MGQFADDEFDIVYSNSVIEHVGDFTAMHRMAREIRRVGKRHFVQTPNKYFPVEPHFVFPAFQFLPKPLQLGLVQNFQLGWMDREPDKARAAAIIDSIHLLSLRDMKVLFPTSGIRPEKTLGMTKSFIACSEW
jgi:2-polyprenyl-3-methyl-5-hydroxy-6-metoxy-1,4-benzoquinol methylase